MTGEELRKARCKAGLTMKQAAELSGTPYRTWQDWETGRRRCARIALAWLELLAKNKKLKDGLVKVANADVGEPPYSDEGERQLWVRCRMEDVARETLNRCSPSPEE